MSNQSKTKSKILSPPMLLLIVGLLLGVGIVLSTKLPKEKERSSWVPLVAKKLEAAEQIAMAKLMGPSQVDRSIRNYQRQIYADPKKTMKWVLLGKAWVRKARGSSEMAYYKHVDACVTIALHLAPEHSIALNLKGLSLLQQHKFRDAIKVAKRILKKKKDDAMAWGTMSDAFLEMGMYKQASMAVERMNEIKPNLPSYIRAAHLMWLQGNLLAAKKLMEHAYDAGRGQKDREPVAWVLSESARVFWHAGNYKEAGQGADLALQYVSDYPPALVLKSQVLMAQGKPKMAIPLLNNAYNQRPLAHTAWLLGDAKWMTGDQKGAQEAYEIVEKLGQDDRRVLGLFYATKNRKIVAGLKLMREEYKVRADIYTEDVIAWLMYRRGRFKEALQRINRSTIHKTKDALLYFHKGAILIANQKVKEGRSWIKKALFMNPHFDMSGAQEARAILKKTAHLVSKSPSPKPQPPSTRKPG